MFRNQYDTDCITWSPAGRIHQIEYAMEAVKQGSACLGIVGSKYVVLAALKRSPHDLAAYQKKILESRPPPLHRYLGRKPSSDSRGQGP